MTVIPGETHGGEARHPPVGGAVPDASLHSIPG